MPRVITFAAGLILVAVSGFLLVVGRGLLIPIVIAVFIWHLLNTIDDALQQIKIIRASAPSWLGKFLAVLIFMLLVIILINIISNNVNNVIEASPRYQEKLQLIVNKINNSAYLKKAANFDTIVKNLNLQNILINIYAVFSTIMSSAVLIALYVVFLFIEQHYFKQKMQFLFPQLEHRQLVDNIFSHIVKDTQTYLGLKTLLSLATALASWIIMKCVGLDFAEFWALLIFFLNYIPNIGPILAIIFPALLAMIQFNSWLPFIVISAGIGTIQFIVGNFVEPRYLGKSLNLSPLVIMFALAFWGAMWGILGMFLSVPVTVMMMITFAHFDTTRPIAILLSQNGRIKKNYQQIAA